MALAVGAVVAALAAVVIDARFPSLATGTGFDWSVRTPVAFYLGLLSLGADELEAGTAHPVTVVVFWLTAASLAYPFTIGDWWTLLRNHLFG